MVHILICDDDKITLEQIREITESTLNKKEEKFTIQCFCDPSDIELSLLKGSDIALLDIDFEKKEYTGIDLAKELRIQRKDAVIIFITNFIEYAPEGYEVQAFRYVMKQKLGTQLPQYLVQALQQLQTGKETLKINICGEIIDVPIREILYAEVRQHDITLHVRYGNRKTKDYLIHTPLSELEAKLKPYGFLRIHKSFLVNANDIQRFHSKGALLSDGTHIRVSETNYAENKRKFLLWKGCL